MEGLKCLEYRNEFESLRGFDYRETIHTEMQVDPIEVLINQYPIEVVYRH